MTHLQYIPFSSCLDVGFFHEFSKRKVEVYGLSEEPVPIHGFYSNGEDSGLLPRLTVEYNAFESIPQIPSLCFKVKGKLIPKNTIEGFKECSKKELINNASLKLWEDIVSGRAEADSNRLNQILILIFADVKKYRYYYWCAFPAANFPAETHLLAKPVRLDESHFQDVMIPLQNAFDKESETGMKPFFLIHILHTDVTLHSLKNFTSLFKKDGKVLLGFCDPSTDSLHPGWPLRNLLSLAAARWSAITLEYDVLCLRDRTRDGVRTIGHSLLLSVKLNVKDNKEIDKPDFVGWERNERQQLGPRLMNLSNTMDPVKLIESSVNLNLELMKWRLVPDLDLTTVKETKCLLLGAGTLGCNVARALVGWGVRKITFIDNGRVSYSNPVRQSLFKFEDCLNGGKSKAQAAASAIKDIFPGIDASGITLSIPMPGHAVDKTAEEKVGKDVETLENLVENHDVVFLLTDTRESRWLPSVMAAAKKKIVINAALGFDTFLVMRHGLKVSSDETFQIEGGKHASIPGNKLGCYFCNDVVAPGDSTRDRTLDQQCTVTRPGVSMLAGGLAVELLVSILQYPGGGLVPAVMSAADDYMTSEHTTVLGIVPHQIRGFLSWFYHVLPASLAFEKCTACSDIVTESYKTEGFEFLLRAFNEPSFLEDLTGLTELHNETQTAEVWELDDD